MLDYNESSKWQASTNSYAIEVLKKCGESLASSGHSQITVADFGCSHGKNSMTCIKSIFDGFPMHSNANLKVILNDLPENNFLEVEKCLKNPQLSFKHHNLPAAKQAKYEFCGRSFYLQCAKDREVDLAFTLQSLHWLENPYPTTKSLFSNSSFLTEIERQQTSKQAHREFLSFLKFRAQELKEGGNLLITMLMKSSYIETICQGWLDYLEAEGYTTAQFESVIIPAYSRSSKEVDLALTEVSHLFNVIYRVTHADGKVQVEVSTLKATTFNTLLEGVEASNVFSTSAEYHQFLNGFFSYLEPTWPPELQQEFHLILLERQSN